MTTPLTPPVSLLHPGLRGPSAPETLPGLGSRGPSGVTAGSGGVDPEAVRETAREFESLLLKQLVEVMRTTTLEDEEASGGQLVDHLIEDGLANHLARSGGIGLGEYLTRDLAPSALAAPVPSAPQARGAAGFAASAAPQAPMSDLAAPGSGASFARPLRGLKLLPAVPAALPTTALIARGLGRAPEAGDSAEATEKTGD